ncbi:MAG: restriction endonuclease subunit S, partial [Bacilli bacterium]
PISDDDKNYYGQLPNNWCFCRLSNIIKLTSGCDLKPTEYTSENNNGNIPYITGASNFTDNTLLINRYTQQKKCNSHLNDILITCKGTIGKIVINTIGNIHIARQVMGITTFIDVDYNRLLVLNISKKLQIKAKSMIPGIERNDLLSEVITIPNLCEQKRICQVVNKINALL